MVVEAASVVHVEEAVVEGDLSEVVRVKVLPHRREASHRPMTAASLYPTFLSDTPFSPVLLTRFVEMVRRTPAVAVVWPF